MYFHHAQNHAPCITFCAERAQISGRAGAETKDLRSGYFSVQPKGIDKIMKNEGAINILTSWVQEEIEKFIDNYRKRFERSIFIQDKSLIQLYLWVSLIKIFFEGANFQKVIFNILASIRRNFPP